MTSFLRAPKAPLALLLAAALACALAPPAWAQQTFTVTTTSDSGPGSLRQAMTEANDASGLPADTIAFDLPTSDPGYDAATGTWAISLTSDLPGIADPAWLDATTQPGYTDRPLVDLIDAVLAITSGSETDGSDSFVGGLILGGINVGGFDRVEIRGNYIGTDALGESSRGGSGIRLFTAHDVVIAQNVISGNYIGINTDSFPGASGRITGNYIGTNAAGDAAIPNSTGISIEVHNEGLLIGGTSEADRNVISGNSGDGIEIGEGTDNVVLGNYIGTNAAGDAPLPNGGGVSLGYDASFNQIGGIAPGEGNVIAYNQGAGIGLSTYGYPYPVFLEGNSFRGNSIFQNGGLGIALVLKEGDQAQSSPVLSNAGYDAADDSVTVAYRLDAGPVAASEVILIDVYLSDDGEGRTYLGTDVFTEADFDSGPEKGFTFAPAAPVTAEDSLVATATSLYGTSEFSPAIGISALIADATPPVCGPINVERNAEDALAAVSTSASDPESGIASAAFTTLRNLEGFLNGSGGYAEGDSQSFDPAATEMVAIRGERLDFSRGGAIMATVTNGVGLTAQCDPAVEQLSAEVPQRFALEGSYPNPFRSETHIGFSLAEASEVTLEVYDLLGRKVATLMRGEEMAARHYEVAWDGRDASGRALAPGVYFYRIRAGAFTDTGRTVLVR